MGGDRLPQSAATANGYVTLRCGKSSFYSVRASSNALSGEIAAA